MARIGLHGVGLDDDGGVRLAGIALDVDDGEHLCVLGRSGSGKTRLLRLVAGLDRPTEGTVTIDDRDVTGLATRHRRVGLVLREDVLPAGQRTAEAIRMPLLLRRRRGDHARAVRNEAARLGIDDLLDTPVGELSGGQRVMVQSARALVDPPTVLLLDEPFADLDPPRRVVLRRRLAERWRHMTVMIATSDPDEALAVSDRVALLDAGRLLQVGAPADVRARPADVDVAQLIGEPAMALLPGAVHDADGLELSVAGQRTRAWSPALRAYRGLPVVVGMWPEAVSEPPRRGTLTVTGRIELVQPHGSRSVAHVEIPGSTVLRTWVRHGHRRGETITLGLDPLALHVFDPVRGTAICHPLDPPGPAGR